MTTLRFLGNYSQGVAMQLNRVAAPKTSQTHTGVQQIQNHPIDFFSFSSATKTSHDVFFAGGRGRTGNSQAAQESDSDSESESSPPAQEVRLSLEPEQGLESRNGKAVYNFGGDRCFVFGRNGFERLPNQDVYKTNQIMQANLDGFSFHLSPSWMTKNRGKRVYTDGNGNYFRIKVKNGTVKGIQWLPPNALAKASATRQQEWQQGFYVHDH